MTDSADKVFRLNIIAVDDEKILLADLEQVIKDAIIDCDLSCFRKSKEALLYAREHRIDIAFLDIEMGGMNGLQLAKALKEINGKTNIVFVTGYSEYALDSYKVPACDFIMKPVTKDAVLTAMDRLRNPVIKIDKRLKVQCFGNFDVYADGKPLYFSRVKAKEIFAYLVSRKGARCNINEIMAVIWEGRDDSGSLKSQFRTIVAELNQSLKDVGLDDVLIKERGYLAVIPDKFSCDMYEFCNADSGAVNKYNGEYMAQYSWAEFTNAYLIKNN